MPDTRVENGDGGSASNEEPPDDTEFVEKDPTQRYGRYKDVLGKGAFKTVYRAFDEIDGIEVAWNQVRIDDLLHSSDDLDRLYSEVRLLKTVKHKNIIKFYNSWIDSDNKTVNIITEIFTSGNLRQYRKKHKHVDIKAVKGWARQVLLGLQYLHSHDPPIIHRDLKCDNIFVNGNNGEVKIGDLGLATLMRQTHVHSVIGTPEFMAPELYEEDYDELVDIYSFGMCLLEMVTFEYPYSECANPAQIFKKVTSGIKPAALSKVKDPQVKAFIEKCLVARPYRLPAIELLQDPFLQSDGYNGSITPTCYSPTISEDGHATCYSSVGNDDDDMSLDAASEFSAGEEVPQDLFHFESPASKKRFQLRGKRTDRDTVKIKVFITDPGGTRRQIGFRFYLSSDTAVSITEEMVLHIGLSKLDSTHIAGLIDDLIEELVPGWHSNDVNENSKYCENGNISPEENTSNDLHTGYIEKPVQLPVADPLQLPIVDPSNHVINEELETSGDPRFEGNTYGRFEEFSCNQSGSEFSPTSSVAPVFVGDDQPLPASENAVAGTSFSENGNLAAECSYQTPFGPVPFPEPDSGVSASMESETYIIKVDDCGEHGSSVTYLDTITDQGNTSQLRLISSPERQSCTTKVNNIISHGGSVVAYMDEDIDLQCSRINPSAQNIFKGSRLSGNGINQEIDDGPDDESDEELFKHLDFLKKKQQEEINALMEKHQQDIDDFIRAWKEKRKRSFRMSIPVMGEAPARLGCESFLDERSLKTASPKNISRSSLLINKEEAGVSANEKTARSASNSVTISKEETSCMLSNLTSKDKEVSQLPCSLSPRGKEAAAEVILSGSRSQACPKEASQCTCILPIKDKELMGWTNSLATNDKAVGLPVNGVPAKDNEPSRLTNSLARKKKEDTSPLRILSANDIDAALDARIMSSKEKEPPILATKLPTKEHLSKPVEMLLKIDGQQKVTVKTNNQTETLPEEFKNISPVDHRVGYAENQALKCGSNNYKSLHAAIPSGFDHKMGGLKNEGKNNSQITMDFDAQNSRKAGFAKTPTGPNALGQAGSTDGPYKATTITDKERSNLPKNEKLNNPSGNVSIGKQQQLMKSIAEFEAKTLEGLKGSKNGFLSGFLSRSK